MPVPYSFMKEKTFGKHLGAAHAHRDITLVAISASYLSYDIPQGASHFFFFAHVTTAGSII